MKYPKPTYDPRFGNLLRSMRREKEIKQEYLAMMTGLKTSTISRIERGRYKAPDYNTVRAMLYILGIPLCHDYIRLLNYSVLNRTPDIYEYLMKNRGFVFKYA